MPGLQGNLYTVLANHNKLSDVQYRKQLELYGLNESYWVKFQKYVVNMLTFNFGISYQSNTPVSQDITSRLSNTLMLLGASTVIAILIGIALGIVAASRRGSSIDSLMVTASLTTFSLPVFFMGIMLIFLFVFTFPWFPASSVVDIGLIHASFWVQLPNRLQHLFLPALTLTLFSYGGFLLLTRATMLETLNEDYILTARAKGLSGRAVLVRHAFKNASLPIITASALSFGTILSGAIITETIFNWAGLGRWLFDAVQYKDFPVMQAMFFIIALTVIAANFVADVVYGVVDPRIKYE